MVCLGQNEALSSLKLMRNYKKSLNKNSETHLAVQEKCKCYNSNMSEVSVAYVHAINVTANCKYNLKYFI